MWSGNELATRLRVSRRTVRRDVDRLRELGYPVRAMLGAGGGYRAVVTLHLPASRARDRVAGDLEALEAARFTGSCGAWRQRG